MTLPEFLLARIAGREAAIDFARKHGFAFPVMSSVEMLAECEAKRQIVEDYQEAHRKAVAWSRHDSSVSREAAYWDVLVALALPHADHPDCDEAWRP